MIDREIKLTLSNYGLNSVQQELNYLNVIVIDSKN